MQVKDQVLNALINRGDEFVSGEKLAQEINCSRTAVWKAIQTLTADGFEIESQKGLGYRLERDAFTLNEQVLTHLLDESLPYHIKTFDSLPSTNDYLRSHVWSLPDYQVVIASEQLAGRGRQGRGFYSPPGSGLYMSVLLHPQVSLQSTALLTLACAAAAAQAIESLTTEKVAIKWVNDLYMRHKKVAGILTEAQASLEIGKVDYAILGIGLNVYPPADGFPNELVRAGSIFTTRGERDMRGLLAVRILEYLYPYILHLEEKAYLDDYRRRSFLLGKKLTYQVGKTTGYGMAKSILDDGALVLATEEGEKILRAGEVHLQNWEG